MLWARPLRANSRYRQRTSASTSNSSRGGGDVPGSHLTEVRRDWMGGLGGEGAELELAGNLQESSERRFDVSLMACGGCCRRRARQPRVVR